ncbi:MAG: helix-turn-helix transcriptional regulator [Candidatus Omnitrophota bacterium]|jgi:transcriptional regulator with XRE-family HTH domain
MANLGKQFLIFLGKKIRNERERMGVSQEGLGKLAKFHRTYIGMIERGEKNITIFNLKRIASALDVKVKDLIDF